MTLRERRKKRGLTQDQLSVLSGVSQSLISKIERGDVQSPGWDVVNQLARALKAKPQDLFTSHESRAVSA